MKKLTLTQINGQWKVDIEMTDPKDFFSLRDIPTLARVIRVNLSSFMRKEKLKNFTKSQV